MKLFVRQYFLCAPVMGAIFDGMLIYFLCEACGCF